MVPEHEVGGLVTGPGARGLPRRSIAIGTALFAVCLILLTGQRAVDAYRVRQEVEAVRREIAALRVRNLALQADLSSPRLDEEIERTARQELGLMRPGDHPVALIWPDGGPSPNQTSLQRSSTADPNWRTWLRLFLDLDPTSH